MNNLSNITQKSKPFDTRQNEPTVMIQIGKNISTYHQQPFPKNNTIEHQRL